MEQELIRFNGVEEKEELTAEIIGKGGYFNEVV